MPDGYIPTQFVAEQLHYPVVPPGESVESSVVSTPTADSQDSASEDGDYYSPWSITSSNGNRLSVFAS